MRRWLIAVTATIGLLQSTWAEEAIKLTPNEGIELRTAFFVANAAELVYEKETDVIRILKEMGLEHKQFLKSASTPNAQDTQGFIATLYKGTLLCFRGTESRADWYTNVSYGMIDSPLGKVHGGFWAAWQDVKDSVYQYLASQRIEPKNPARPLWLCGHSLGGAIAALAGVQLHREGYSIKGVFTFGQPRVFNAIMAAGYAIDSGEKYPPMYRYLFNSDPVPSVPPAWMGFSHLGAERYGKEVGKIFQAQARGWFWPLPNDHSMVNYKKLLAALVSITDDPNTREVLKWLDDRKVAIGKKVCADWRANWERHIFHWTEGAVVFDVDDKSGTAVHSPSC